MSRALILLALALAVFGCRKAARSSGTCEGRVGQLDVSGALTPRSAFSLDWNQTAHPLSLKLDCGGKLIALAKAKPRDWSGRITATIATDDPACYPADGGARSPSHCRAQADSYCWVLLPKERPRIVTGSIDAAFDAAENVLRGRAELQFADGSEAAVQFAVAAGSIDAELVRMVEVSAIPGRISFSGH